MAQGAKIVSLRERKRQETRDALVEAAFRLFEAKGYDATPVDEIAAAAEVSRRTFFRYFSCKEEVVFPNMAARLAGFRTALEVAEGPPAARVRAACLAMAAELAANREELLRQHRLMSVTPALLAFDQKGDVEWERAIAEVLRDGQRSEGARRRAEVWAGAIMGAVRATLRSWFATEGVGDLVAIGAEALDHLEMGMATAMPKRVVGAR